jgi:hypothetical protein
MKSKSSLTGAHGDHFDAGVAKMCPGFALLLQFDENVQAETFSQTYLRLQQLPVTKTKHCFCPFLFSNVKESQEILTYLPRFDLISLTFHENSNRGRENY